MKINKLKLLANLFMALFLAFVLIPIMGAAFGFGTGAALFALGFVPNQKALGILNIGLQMEVWEQDIQEVLWPKNDFKNFAINNSQFVDGGNVVHRPQAGTVPTVVKNRQELPAKVTKASDTDETYELDWYTTNPILITGAEEQWLSYDKRSSVLKRHLDVLNDEIAKGLIYNWSPSLAASFVRTSGDADASGFNLPSSGTGTRKKVQRADLFNLAKNMDDRLVPSSGRKLLMPPAMYYEIFGDDYLALALAMGGKNIMSDGIVNELAGFEIMIRPNIGRYSNAGTPVLKAEGAANLAADNFYALAWHPSFVDVAQGGIKMRMNDEDAIYYGSVMTGEVFFGGSKMRQTTEIGVAALIQAAG